MLKSFLEVLTIAFLSRAVSAAVEKVDGSNRIAKQYMVKKLTLNEALEALDGTNTQILLGKLTLKSCADVYLLYNIGTTCATLINTLSEILFSGVDAKTLLDEAFNMIQTDTLNAFYRCIATPVNCLWYCRLGQIINDNLKVELVKYFLQLSLLYRRIAPSHYEENVTVIEEIVRARAEENLESNSLSLGKRKREDDVIILSETPAKKGKINHNFDSSDES